MINEHGLQAVLAAASSLFAPCRSLLSAVTPLTRAARLSYSRRSEGFAPAFSRSVTPVCQVPPPPYDFLAFSSSYALLPSSVSRYLRRVPCSTNTCSERSKRV